MKNGFVVLGKAPGEMMGQLVAGGGGGWGGHN